MKKLVLLILTLSLLSTALFLPSCASNKESDKIKILCTVFPLYDWARSVVGDSAQVEVSLLVENGTDLHSFQPSFGDMAKIKDSDIVIYVGGTSDKWVADSIDQKATAIELSALDSITLYQISADSLANAHTHEDGEECHEEHDRNHAFDEHIWLSLKNAKAATEKICTVLSNADADNAQVYQKNTERYIERLTALDTQMSEVSKRIDEQLIFADRFPFVYLLSDYNIGYFAAFEGCSTDTGADFDTVITLSKKLENSKNKLLFVSERPIPELAASIAKQAHTDKPAKILTLNSMQSLGRTDIDGGASYIDIMEQNIKNLEESL